MTSTNAQGLTRHSSKVELEQWDPGSCLGLPDATVLYLIEPQKCQDGCPRAGLLLLPLFLCFGPETAGSIDPAALRVIVHHVNCNGGVNSQYAFTATLPHGTSSNPQNVSTGLPTTQLADMRETIRPSGALYHPPSGNIMAARTNEVIMPNGKYTEHNEWHLLSGPNSLVAQLTARTYGQDSCLILFTLNTMELF
ncbi:unnamed protein product [Lepidochelys olivacea]